MMVIFIIICILALAGIGLHYVIATHKQLKEEFKQKNWMDNSEYDYGHDVRHDNSENNKFHKVMAIVKEKGRIAFMSEIQSGTSQSGNGWARQTIVVDIAGYNGSYRKLALKAGTQQVQDLQEMQVGDLVEFSYQVTATEWQGKWYNNVDLYKVEFLEDVQQIQQPVAPAYPQNPQPNMQQFVQNGMYPAQPAPAPAAPAQPRQRGRVQSQPQIPANTPMDLQDGDLPPAIFQ